MLLLSVSGIVGSENHGKISIMDKAIRVQNTYKEQPPSTAL